MWEKSFSTEMPPDVEFLGRGQYLLRRNITKEENGYSYEEQILTESALAVWKSLNERDSKISELSDAIQALMFGEE